MTQDDPSATVWKELDGAAAEYGQAKRAFDAARVRYEVAKRRLEVTKELASEAMPAGEWGAWLHRHSDVKYAGVPIGEAILDHIKSDTRRFYENASDEEFDHTPIFRLDDIRGALARGGFEFKTLTPLREINAALINLAGVEKSGDYYRAGDADEVSKKIRLRRSRGE